MLNGGNSAMNEKYLSIIKTLILKYDFSRKEARTTAKMLCKI
jgi:hypothetical protein